MALRAFAVILDKIKKGGMGLFHRHLAVCVLILLVLLLFDVSMAGGSWVFWPAFAWGLLLFLHYIFVRSRQVDDDWAERRAAELAENAYDFGHVQDLKDRYGEGRADGRKGER